MLLNTVQEEQSLCSYCPNTKGQPVGFDRLPLGKFLPLPFFFLTVLLQTYKRKYPVYNPVLYKLVS